MQWKEPEDCAKYKWTAHVKGKMRHYGLSASRVRRVIKSPMRVEYGVAQDTVAVMQPQSTRRGADGVKTWSSEIWAMYQLGANSKKSESSKSKTAQIAKSLAVVGGGDTISKIAQSVSAPKKMTVISAWRYPGQTKVGESLPQEIWDEIAQFDG